MAAIQAVPAPIQVARLVLPGYFESLFPWPLGTEAGDQERPDIATFFADEWMQASVRLPSDLPVYQEERRRFRAQNRRNRTRDEYRAWRAARRPLEDAIGASDFTGLRNWQATWSVHLGFWRPVRPYPHPEPEMNELARPPRCQVLAFPDLRSMARAFAVPSALGHLQGPGRARWLNAVRIVRFRWVDDARFWHQQQFASSSEWAFGALRCLYNAQAAMPNLRWVHVIFNYNTLQGQPRLNLDSPGIFYLRRLRCAHLVITQDTTAGLGSTPLDRGFAQQIARTVQNTTSAWSARGTELRSLPGYADFNIQEVGGFAGRGNARLREARRRAQLSRLESVYERQHHRLDRNLRLIRTRIRYWRNKNTAAAQANVAWWRGTARDGVVNLQWDSRILEEEFCRMTGRPPRINRKVPAFVLHTIGY